MDHIPYPIHNLSRQLIRIPYICDSQFSYDDQGFLTYPSRVGIDLVDLCTIDNALSLSPALAPFLQAWIWFGLLGETLGVGSRSHIPQKNCSFKVFIKSLPDGGEILTTAELKTAALRRRETTLFPSMNNSFRSR